MPRKKSENSEGFTIQSIQRAIDVLSVLSEKPVPLKAAEISQLTGIHPTTIYGILNTLEQRHMVQKDPLSNTYSLGVEALHIGLAYQRNSPIVRSAIRVSSQFPPPQGTSIRLSLMDGAYDMLSISLSSPLDSPAVRYLLYDSLLPAPALNSSSGKVLLAYSEGAARDGFVARNALRITPEIEDMLQEIRAQGYATDYDGALVGISCVAAPIFGQDGKIIAAISHTGDTNHVKENEKSLIVHIKQIATLITLEMAHK